MRTEFLTVVLWAVALTGCGRPGLTSPGDFYHLSLSNPGSGDVEIATAAGAQTCAAEPCEYDFLEGTQVTLTASDPALTFKTWTDNSKCDTTNPCVIVMDSDQDLGVLFTAHLSVGLQGIVTGATVGIEPGALTCPPDCELDIDAGQVATLTAAQGTLLFKGWSDDCSAYAITEDCTLTMDSHKTGTAAFHIFDTTTFGTTGDDRIHAIAADPTTASGFIIAGTFTQALALDAQTTLSTVGAGRNMYVARMSAEGTVAWAYSFGGDGDALPHAVAARANASNELEVFVGGTMEGEIDHDLDGTPTDEPGNQNGFVLKLHYDVNPNAPRWSQRFTDDTGDNDGNTIVQDISLSGTSVWTTGLLVGDVNMGNGETKDTNQGNRTRMFITEHDLDTGATNGFFWTGEDANSHSEGAGVAFDNNRVLVSGFNDSLLSGDSNMNFSGCNTNNSDSYDAFLFSFDTVNDECVWSRPVNTQTGDQYAPAVAVDPNNGDVYAAAVSGTVILPQRYDSGGIVEWPAIPIATGGPLPTMPVVGWDGVNNELVVAGSFDTSITVDGNTVQADGPTDFFVVRIAQDGTIYNTTTVGGPGTEETGEVGDNAMGKSRPGYGASTIAVFPDGTVAIIGSTDADPINFDGDSFPSVGGLDAVILRVARQ